MGVSGEEALATLTGVIKDQVIFIPQSCLVGWVGGEDAWWVGWVGTFLGLARQGN